MAGKSRSCWRNSAFPIRSFPSTSGPVTSSSLNFSRSAPTTGPPAIVDHAPADGGGPFSVFETGAILIYLADKAGRFLPTEMRARSNVIQWLMWQLSGLGPMLGQHGHFALYAQEKIPYAIERYRDEAARLYRCLDTQLGKTGAYVAGDYSIADIACFPWTMPTRRKASRSTTTRTSSAGTPRFAHGPRCRRGSRSENSSKSRSTRRRGETCSARPRRRWRGESSTPLAFRGAPLREPGNDSD